MSAPSPYPSFYSQFGEDRILARIFGGRNRGACVEVGANNGRDGSTSLYFEQRGWDCVLVEPNPQLCDILRRERRGKVFQCGASSENGAAVLQLAQGEGLAHAVSTLETGAGAEEALRRHGVSTLPIEVPVRRLDDILEEADLPSVDFMSIDVEGHELEVLKGFTPGRWRPTIMILEDNSRFRDGSVRDHLRERGYVRFLRTGVNDWYAHREDARLVGRWRRLGYFRSAASASAFLAWSAMKTQLARIPGILPLARRLKRLRQR